MMFSISCFSLSCLRCLTGLENLRELRLKDVIHNLSNPVCQNIDYGSEIMSMFPSLNILDGTTHLFITELTLFPGLNVTLFPSHSVLDGTTHLFITELTLFPSLNILDGTTHLFIIGLTLFPSLNVLD